MAQPLDNYLDDREFSKIQYDRIAFTIQAVRLENMANVKYMWHHHLIRSLINCCQNNLGKVKMCMFSKWLLETYMCTPG